VFKNELQKELTAKQMCGLLALHHFYPRQPQMTHFDICDVFFFGKL